METNYELNTTYHAWADSIQPFAASWSPRAVKAADVSCVMGLLMIIATVSAHLERVSAGKGDVWKGGGKLGDTGNTLGGRTGTTGGSAECSCERLVRGFGGTSS